MPVCPSCSKENPDDVRFCMECGTSLEANLASLDLLEAGIVCPACDTYNEPDRKTCVRCGQSIAGMTGFLKAIGDSPDVPKTTPQIPVAVPAPPPHAESSEQSRVLAGRAESSELPPPAKAAGNATGQMPAATGREQTVAECPHCQAKLPPASQFCLACGQRVGAAPARAPAGMSVRVRLVRGYGRQDSTFPVAALGVTVGRRGAIVSIPGDPYLSPAHFALRLENGNLVLEDLASRNGTYLRLRGKTELHQGAELVAGSQHILLLGLGGPTTDVRTPRSLDTRPYGGPLPRQLFVALRTLHVRDSAPVGGSILLRSGPIISLGQGGCDINFPADERMSPRHLELHLKPSGLEAIEFGSNSGTYVRISAPVTLQNGDEILSGEELFRVEMT